MRGVVPAPKGRVRTAVKHTYLDALKAKVNGSLDAPSSSRSRPESAEAQPGLDLLVLGMTSGTTMNGELRDARWSKVQPLTREMHLDIDFALCRFTQETPEAALHLDVVQACLY